ncbi:SHOCT domain-containing protein [Cryobacterium ruanii]|nr:SHOCT domain-containing protein [Cryobacterium ruanii]
MTAEPAQTDVLAQIQKLSELQAAGVLTEAEFAQKKVELLARL